MAGEGARTAFAQLGNKAVKGSSSGCHQLLHGRAMRRERWTLLREAPKAEDTHCNTGHLQDVGR